MNQSMDAARLWLQQRRGIIWICGGLLIAYAYWLSTADEREAKRLADEKSSIGMQATVAGTMVASSAKACQKIGAQNLQVCASNTGTLVFDIVAKEQAKIALEQKASFDAACGKHFSAQYCLDLLNRALQIAWSNPN